MKTKKIVTIISIALIIGLIAGFGFTWYITQQTKKSDDGLKKVTIVVEDNNGKEESFTDNMDAATLREAMDKMTDFEFDGNDSEYGIMVTTVNGIVADDNKDGAYWAFYVNGKYCEYGIEEQPVKDGDIFRIEYTVDEK